MKWMSNTEAFIADHRCEPRIVRGSSLALPLCSRAEGESHTALEDVQRRAFYRFVIHE
jgi:hypothetical protein